MNEDIKIHDKVIRFNIPVIEDDKTELNNVVGHLIEYKGNKYTQHGYGSMESPVGKITFIFSDFETGGKIREIEFFSFELLDGDTKENAIAQLKEIFEKYIKPILDRHEAKLDEVKARYPIINKEVVYENGPIQKELDECEGF